MTAKSHSVLVAHRGDELQSLLLQFVEPGEVDSGEVDFAGLHRCHARGDFRHLPDDELAMCAVSIQCSTTARTFATVIGLPLADGEWA